MDIYSQQGSLVNLDVGNSVKVSINDLMNADELVVQIDKKAPMENLYTFFKIPCPLSIKVLASSCALIFMFAL